jgi:hypothetical protein
MAFTVVGAAAPGSQAARVEWAVGREPTADREAPIELMRVPPEARQRWVHLPEQHQNNQD